MSVSYGGDSITFADGSVQSGGWTGMRNRIINGAMMIDQRNAAAEVNPAVNGVYYLDRWQATSSAASKFKIGQNAGAVTPPTGYINYLGCTSLSAYSVGAGEAFIVRQKIEGLNVADLALGTASAATVTLSFWVRSSLTGTFGGSLTNSAENRSYPFTYTISTANTFEQKTITITGDTSGTWLTTNGVGLMVNFSLGAGATLSGTAGTWAAADYRSATGATSVVGTNGATFYITGVQLERGSTASSFEYRPYGTELQLCQRYFFKTDVLGVGAANATTGFVSHIAFGVPMRTFPSIVAVAGTSWIISDDYITDYTAASPTIATTYSISSTSWRGQLTGFSGLTTGRFYGWVPAVGNAISFSSEL